MIFNQWQTIIAKAIKESNNLTLGPEEVLIEHPENEKFGDYSTNIALVLAKKLKKKPVQLAEEIVNQLQKILPREMIDSIKIDGPGFINLSIKNEWFIKELGRVIKEGGKFGTSKLAKEKKVMVEYAHPNTHKLFHIGHLRNITNGEAMVRILEAIGCKVIRTNYQGDVGLHIAKCLYGILQILNLVPPAKPLATHGKSPAYTKVFDSEAQTRGASAGRQISKLKTLDQKIEFLSKAYVEGNRAYENDSDAQKEILKINNQIYQKDSKIIELWQKTRQWSLDYFERIYKRLDTHFDRYYFESEVAEKGKKIVLENLEKEIFVRSKGAIIFPGSKYGLHDRVFITQEDNPTYEAKDMELGRLQFEEYQPDLIIHNVGPEQSGYFKVVFKALEQLFPKTKDKEYHLMYGWVRLKKGKMSSREGNIITAEWLLDEAKKRIKKSFPQVDEQTAEAIAVGAVKYSFLKVSPATEVAFDFNESISLEGNSGPYLQYTYARCQSVLKKGNFEKLNPDLLIDNILIYYKQQKEFINDEEKAILKTFYKFSEIVLKAAKEYSPNLISNFLYDLAQKYNTFYNKHRILSNQKELKRANYFRLLLTAVTAQLIKNGLYFLGIKTPKTM